MKSISWWNVIGHIYGHSRLWRNTVLIIDTAEEKKTYYKSTKAVKGQIYIKAAIAEFKYVAI